MKARLTTGKAGGNAIGIAAALVCLATLAACTGKPVNTSARPSVAAVVARVNGQPIVEADVEAEAALQGLAPAQIIVGGPDRRRIIDELMDQKLLAAEAVKRGFDRDAEGRRRLAAARERSLADRLLETQVRGVATPEAVNGLYQEMIKARSAADPAATESLESARPRIVRFLTYDRVKDLLLDLRHRATLAVTPDPVGVPPPPPPRPAVR